MIKYRDTNKGLILTTVCRGCKVVKLYRNYTLKEAVHLFKEYLKTL